MSSSNSVLQSTYPWTKAPLIASAPMLNIALPPLAISVSEAGGLGFLAGGLDVSNLERNLEETARLVRESKNAEIRNFHAETGILPAGVGFINWGADLEIAVTAIGKYRPCAVWFFAPRSQPNDLRAWVERVRAATDGRTKIWVQVGTVIEAMDVVEALRPDVLVIQGSDAGGHGLARSASVITLVPEVRDALHVNHATKDALPVILAAGGVVDGRGMAASLALGSSGVVMGTRFLASSEATVARGYQAEVLRASDGGRNTVRSTVYDRVRGIGGWPDRYDGRGVINESYVDAVEKGMDEEENRRLYQEEMKKGDDGWGPAGRMTTYAGTGVGLIKEALPVATILERVRCEANGIIKNLAGI